MQQVRADLRSTVKEHAAIIRSEDAPAQGAAARAVVASGGGDGGGGDGGGGRGMGFQRKIQGPSRQEAAVGVVDAAHPALDMPPLHDTDEEDRLHEALVTAEARCGHGGYGVAGGTGGGGGGGGGSGGRQQLMVVASLIDRVPNLAGLARTAEVLQVWSAPPLLVWSAIRIRIDCDRTHVAQRHPPSPRPLKFLQLCV